MEKTGGQKSDEEKRVDISTEESIAHWAKHLNCSKTDLVRAVIQVGTSITAVDAYLEMNRKKNG
ncbi:MAG TPA: DUF3606 domain-containing protein [Flavobacteriales bacterium]|nr:DUF3606 domain-containing protein [Flavobacteriales bacterium]